MKNLVAINISSGSFIEVVKYNVQNAQIEDYLKEEISYDSSVRKIADYNDLKESIKAIFSQMGLNGRQDVVIALPTIFLNHSELPSSLDNESLITALSSEAENNYLFSNSDPKVSYQVISEDEEEGTQHLVYTAYHKDEIEQIQVIFKELGHNIIAIDNSYASFVRTIISTSKVDREIQSFANWILLSIRGNSFVVLSFTGNKLLELVEKPLATRSATQDELYDSICSSLNDIIDDQMPDKVLVTSSFDDISAEVIAGKVSQNCEVDFIEFNKFSQVPFVNVSHNVPPSIAPLITPEVNGAATILTSTFPLKFDYILGVMAEGVARKQSSSSLAHLKKILVPLIIVLLVVDVFSIGAIKMLSSGIERKLGSLTSTKRTLEQRVRSTTIDEAPQSDPLELLLIDLEKQNQDLVKSFNSLAVNIPEKLWLTNVEINHDLSGHIEGKSFRMEDIAIYFKTLKSLSKMRTLRINTLKVDGNAAAPEAVNSFSSSVDIQVKNNSLPNIPINKNSKTQKSYYFNFRS